MTATFNKELFDNDFDYFIKLIFNDVAIENIKVDIEQKFGPGMFQEIFVYSGNGDIFSWFTRLLIIVKEILNDKDLINKADERIQKLDIKQERLEMDSDENRDGEEKQYDYIRHLRNAFLHGNYSIRQDNNPGDTELIFWDKKPNSNIIHTKFVLNKENVNQTFYILADVCFEWLFKNSIILNYYRKKGFLIFLQMINSYL